MREMKKGSLGMLALHLLNERPSYGYELCARLRERSAGTLTFEDAAVYPLLHDYERRGLLEGYWERSDESAVAESIANDGAPPAEQRRGPRRRYYRITPAGRAALRASIAEWSAFARGVARILDAPDVEGAAE